jgi:ATP-dependent Clp protease protease subunit
MRQPNRLLNLLQLNARQGSFRAEAATNTMYLYDTIAGDQMEAEMFGGVTAIEFVGALSAMSGPVSLRLNSPGGDVFAGWAMAQAMRDYQAKKGPITVYVDGVAASAASIVATAGKRVLMARSSMMMIHKAWSMVVGNSNDMIETANLLNKVDGLLSQSYAERAGGDPGAFLTMMEMESWFTPDDAIALKLADGLAEDVEVVNARWDLSVYTKVPAVLQAVAEAAVADDPTPEPEPQPAVEAGPEPDEDVEQRLCILHAELLHRAA